MKNYIVLHTHWDREWYFTTSDSLVLMDRTFKNIINELELYPEISFCLDGQYSIIEEFLNINSDLENQVAKLVKENRLQIGPWYTQTDTQLVAEESIVRNLYYGMNKTIDRFGKVMGVGYLPDTFGFCHQMPEIYNLASIDKAVFWRGADFRDGTKPYFHWQGAGRSTVKTINLFGGYGMAKDFNSETDYIEKTLNPLVTNYRSLGIDCEILIPVGNDQFEIKEDIPKTVNQINKHSNLNIEVSDYAQSIDNIFENETFDTYTREFRKTAYTRLHKSIGSVRYDLKQENYNAEQLLINEVEPLFVIGKQFGINPSINLLYSAWSLLFEGHAHDGICGCISDGVYDDMQNRIKRAQEIGNSLKNLIMKQIANQLGVENSEVLIINTAPVIKSIHEIVVYSEYDNIEIIGCNSEILSTEIMSARDDALVETPLGNVYEHIDEMYIHRVVVECELEPFEIKVLKLAKRDKKATYQMNVSKISNEFVCAEVIDHKLNLIIDDQHYNDAISIVECGNDGDTYDFSPVANDQQIIYQIVSSKTIINNLKSEIEIEYKAMLPRDIKMRTLGEKQIEDTIKLFISIYQGDRKLYFKLNHHNQVLSHKLCVRVNIGSSVEKTISSSAYGQIERDVVLDENIVNWQSTNVEKPVSIETFDGFVKSTDDKLTILSSYGKEYQGHDNFIDLTVYATTGELGRSNLINRPGRASGDVTKKGHIKMDTPKAQCLGQGSFEFGLVAGNDDYFDNMYDVQDYRTGAVSYQVQEINKFEGRIDNKLKPYRDGLKQKVSYEPLKIETNGYITSVGIGLKGETIVRGVANAEHQFLSNRTSDSIDLLGHERSPDFKKYQIFNYKLEE